MARAVIFAALLGLAAVLPRGFAYSSGGCGQFFVHQKVVQAYAAPTLAYAPAVYYQAGLGVEQDALAEKIARIVTARLESQIAARLTQSSRTSPGSTSVLAQRCSRCHAGAAPKAGIVLDGATPLLCHQITAAIRSVRDDSMPKGGPPLSPEDKGRLLEELLALESSGQEADRTQPLAVPKPEPAPEPPGVLK